MLLQPFFFLERRISVADRLREFAQRKPITPHREDGRGSCERRRRKTLSKEDSKSPRARIVAQMAPVGEEDGEGEGSDMAPWVPLGPGQVLQ